MVGPKVTVERFPTVLDNDTNRLVVVADIIRHLARCGIREIAHDVQVALRLFGRQWLADSQATMAARAQNNQITQAPIVPNNPALAQAMDLTAPAPTTVLAVDTAMAETT